MKLKGLSLFILMLTMLLFISACNQSEEDIQSDAKELFENMLLEDVTKDVTFSDERIELYLPGNAETDRVDDSNVLIDYGGRVLLLFAHEAISIHNEEELLETLMVEEEPFIFEMGESSGKLAYFVVLKSDEDKYATIIGYDHFKLTTLTSLDNIIKDAEMMFDIVRSANFK